MNDLLLKACRREKTERRPIWLMRQAGRYLPEYREIRERYNVLDICKRPELAAEITALPIEKFGMDAAIIFSDITLPLEALGMKVKIDESSGPVIKNPVRRREDVERIPEFRGEEVYCVYEAIRHARRLLNDEVPIIGFSGAPFTLACYIVDGRASRSFPQTKALMHSDLDAWDALLRKLSEMVLEYLKLQIKAGAKVIQLFDSWAGCLGPIDYERFVLPYSKYVISRIIEVGVPVIHFGTCTSSLLPLMKKAGGNVIGVDWRVSIDEAWRMIGYDSGIQGNLDPSVLLTNPSVIKEQAREILRRTDGIAGHVFNLGHGVLPDTPPENVKTLVEYVKSYGVH